MQQNTFSPMEPSQLTRRFEGYRNTSLLWEEKLDGLKMFAPDRPFTGHYPEIPSASRIRLGKLIEQFVLFEIEQDESIELLKSNIQVFRDQITIGELDCLLQQSGVHLHLEIVFKFYLYDPSLPGELNRWIGPNRNDSLIFKLNKLKEKQLPLLHLAETAQLLAELNLTPEEFDQRVNFKAQLFVPFHAQEASYPLVNRECITGFYIRQSDLELFSDHTFYIPSKLDWLVDPHLEVGWVAADKFEQHLSDLLTHHRSPLCWMQSPDGKLQKFFVVWWDHSNLEPGP